MPFSERGESKTYLDALKKHEPPIDFEETLDADAQQREMLVIQLRLVEGVDLSGFRLLDETRESIRTIK